jgi:hypothetical protein
MSGTSGTDIERVIAGVKRAIKAAQQSDGVTQAVNIEKLELTLKGLVEKGASGELKIRIPVIDVSLGIGTEITSKELQTIQLTFVPVKAMTRSGSPTEAFEKELVKAIRDIREGIKKAATIEPKFSLQSASIELNFEVNSKGEIALFAKGSGKSEVAQTVKLFLGPM